MTTFSKKDFLILIISMLSTASIFSGYLGKEGLMTCAHCIHQCLTLSGLEKISKLYDEKLRSDFFSGFLAVGAFLLSLKTFIVMTMKTNVYDTQQYKEKWEKQYKLDKKVGSQYKGLRRLNDWMFNSILASLTAAIAQVTIGLIGGPALVFICLLLSFASVLYLIYCLYLVKINLDAIIPNN